jgi:hypothetical protein
VGEARVSTAELRIQLEGELERIRWTEMTSKTIATQRALIKNGYVWQLSALREVRVYERLLSRDVEIEVFAGDGHRLRWSVPGSPWKLLTLLRDRGVHLVVE